MTSCKEVLDIIGLQPTEEQLQAYKLASLVKNYSIEKLSNGYFYKIQIAFPIEWYEKHSEEDHWTYRTIEE